MISSYLPKFCGAELLGTWWEIPGIRWNEVRASWPDITTMKKRKQKEKTPFRLSYSLSLDNQERNLEFLLLYFDGCITVHLFVGPVVTEAMFVNREEIPVYPIYRDPVSSLKHRLSFDCWILFMHLFWLHSSFSICTISTLDLTHWIWLGRGT